MYATGRASFSQTMPLGELEYQLHSNVQVIVTVGNSALFSCVLCFTCDVCQTLFIPFVVSGKTPYWVVQLWCSLVLLALLWETWKVMQISHGQILVGRINTIFLKVKKQITQMGGGGKRCGVHPLPPPPITHTPVSKSPLCLFLYCENALQRNN